jgi:hypothetical protein
MAETTKRNAKYQNVRYWYITKRWNLWQVWCAVNRWITAEEYNMITGKDYDQNVVPSKTEYYVHVFK